MQISCSHQQTECFFMGQSPLTPTRTTWFFMMQICQNLNKKDHLLKKTVSWFKSIHIISVFSTVHQLLWFQILPLPFTLVPANSITWSFPSPTTHLHLIQQSPASIYTRLFASLPLLDCLLCVCSFEAFHYLFKMPSGLFFLGFT